MRTTALVLGMTLFLTAPLAQANPMGPGPYGYPGYRQQDGDGPVKALRQGIQKLVRFLASDQRANREQFVAFLEEEIGPYFDFERMTNWAAGSLHRRMSAAERAEMKQELRRMFLTTMAQKLSNYQHSRVQYLRPRYRRDGAVSLGILAYSGQGRPLRLDFRMNRSEGAWKVYDVSANGQSAAMYYRDYFSRVSRPEMGYPGMRRPAMPHPMRPRAPTRY